jgi:hypothetical protein
VFYEKAKEQVSRMKIVALNPPYLPMFSRASRSPAVTKSSTLYYPFFLSYATGVLEDDGFDVSLIGTGELDQRSEVGKDRGQMTDIGGQRSGKREEKETDPQITQITQKWVWICRILRGFRTGII